MFFLVQRHELLELPPKFFGASLEAALSGALRSKVEGKVSSRWGYTLAVHQITKIGDGKLHEDQGHAIYPVDYIALVFRPLKNEVLYAQVTNVNPEGLFLSAGPLSSIFISKSLMPSDLKFDAGSNGVGCWFSDDEVAPVRYQRGSTLRMRIINFTIKGDKCNVIGTINEDYLG